MSIDDESHELKCLEICPSIKHHHFTDIIYIYYIMSMSEIAVYLPSYHCKKKTILISALKQKKCSQTNPIYKRWCNKTKHIINVMKPRNKNQRLSVS